MKGRSGGGTRSRVHVEAHLLGPDASISVVAVVPLVGGGGGPTLPGGVGRRGQLGPGTDHDGKQHVRALPRELWGQGEMHTR